MIHTAAAYSLKGTKTSNATGLTLYEACKALAAAAEAGDCHDGAHVAYHASESIRPRAVAHWCGWREEVRPMFGALHHERLDMGWDPCLG